MLFLTITALRSTLGIESALSVGFELKLTPNMTFSALLIDDGEFVVFVSVG